MKKLMLWVALLSTASLFAQTPATTPVIKESKPKTEVVKVKPASAVSATTVTPSTATVKKDGTPDKRFKQNKHVKKDGTPDMRYKEHKSSPKAKPAVK